MHDHLVEVRNVVVSSSRRKRGLLGPRLRYLSQRVFVYDDLSWTFLTIWLTRYFEVVGEALRMMKAKALAKPNQRIARFGNHLHSSSNS